MSIKTNKNHQRMNKIFNYLGVFVASILATFNSFAQSSYTLEQSIAYALKNSPIVKNAELDHDISKAKVKETTAIGLPQINGKWDLMHNFNVQKQFFPNSGIPPFGDPTKPVGEPLGVQFGLANSSNASATLTQLIFDGSYLVGLQAAKTYTSLAEQGIAKSKTDLVMNVQKAYYLVLVTQSRITQVEENEKMLQQLMEDTKALSETGFAESIDIKRVTVNLNNLKAEIQKLKSFEEVTLNMLKFQMGMPISENIFLTDNLDSKVAEMTKGNSNANYENRIEVKLLDIQNDLNELNLKNEKIKLLPTLAAFGTVGLNYGTNEFGDVFNFGDYQDYSMIGVSLNVPIWSSWQRKYRIDQAKFEAEKTKNDREQLLNSFVLESSQSLSNLNNNIDILQVRKENADLANEVYENAKIKYEEGVGSSFEVTSAQNDLKTAQTNYYNALYDAIIAKIDLDKANGNLIIE